MTVAGDGALHGGCVLCSSPDFLRGGFGERTMIICDQCEREFHIGCLAQHDRAHLTELPQGTLSSLSQNQCSSLAGSSPLGARGGWSPEYLEVGNAKVCGRHTNAMSTLKFNLQWCCSYIRTPDSHGPCILKS